jgi:hypothetical protein
MNTFNAQPSMKALLGCCDRLSAVLSSSRTGSKMIKATFILAAALTALPAMAETITFSISAQGSGTLGTTPFTDQLITFTEVTDTSNITNPCLGSIYGYPCAPSQAGNTVTIGGIAGTQTISDNTFFFDNAINLVGISGAFFQTYLSAIGTADGATYGMTTAFGPESAPYYTVGSSTLATSGGTLSLTSFSGDATFSAVLGATTAAPEPGTLTLLGSGLLGLVYRLRRKRFAQS